MGRTRSIERRFTFLLVFILACSLGISGRLFFVQAVQASKYGEVAMDQRFRTIKIPPERGIIYDRNGNKLAVNITMDTIYAAPVQIKDDKERADIAKKIAPILKIDEGELLNKLSSLRGFVYLARRIDAKIARAVKEIVETEKIGGIGFLKEPMRYYPNESLASHVIGYAGIDNKGLGGLERYYDELLYGKDGEIRAEKDLKGVPIPHSISSSSRPIDGANIRISIDREIQYKAEVELKSAVEEYRAKSGSVIVMDPKSGEIYAMANVPDFDQNNLNSIMKGSERNRAIIDLYEPGSTMKAVIASGALEEGLCNPDTAFYLEPTVKVGNKRIKESHGRPAKTFTFSEIIQESSNVGMVKIGSLMGKEKIAHYLEKFGFNKKNGIDYPAEAKGYYPDVDKWSLIATANIPFGQGISTTQLQMAKAYAAIANGGVSVNPHFLLEATDKRGRIVLDASTPQPKRVINSDTSDKMKQILEKAVLDGTGGQAKVDGYRVAGKTGTAQKAKVNGRGYEKGKYVASFIGFAPVDNPKLVISVIIDEPQEGIYGGSVAAPAFSKIADFSLRHLKVPPG